MENKERIREGAKNGISLAANQMDESVDATIDEARALSSRVADKARKFGNEVANKADETISSAGHKINDLAGTVRRNLPTDGVVGSAAGAVADSLESGGKYLESHDLESMGKDTAALVRKYPLYSLGVGLLVGALVGKMLPRR